MTCDLWRPGVASDVRLRPAGVRWYLRCGAEITVCCNGPAPLPLPGYRSDTNNFHRLMLGQITMIAITQLPKHD